MKTCKFDKQAHLYPLGMLTPGERAAFEAHMAGCESCAAAAGDAKRLKLMFKTQPAAQPAPGFELRVSHSVKKKSGGVPARGLDWQGFFDFNRALLPVAACLALVMCAAVFFVAGVAPRGGAAQVATTQQSASRDGVYIAGGLSAAERGMLSDSADEALESYYGNLSKH